MPLFLWHLSATDGLAAAVKLFFGREKAFIRNFRFFCKRGIFSLHFPVSGLIKGVKAVLNILALKRLAFEHGGKEEKKNGLFERRNVK